MTQSLTKYYALLCLLTLLLALMLTNKGIAGETEQPQQVIQNISEQIQKKLQNPSFTKNFSQVTSFVNNIIDPHVDFDKIAPLVLGKKWKAATPLEQERFKDEFRTLLVRTYSRAFVEYNQWTINFLPVEVANNATKALVKTTVAQSGQQPVDLYYRMFLSRGEWKVSDIMIDGVSLVTNYRSTFNDEIQNKGSLTAVIDNLAKRNAEALTNKPS
jgi:phospholipid transport system substrate-binding protein